jgi:thymidylate synthase (FAD)
MVDVTFEIKTTREIARQMLRHRSFSFQEFSQRYAEPTFISEYKECRMQDYKNRQNSITASSRETIEWWNKAQEDVLDLVDHIYKAAIEVGIAKEVAREILPEGLTITKLYMKGSLRSWIHYIELRKENGTQKEHAEIANLIFEEIKKLYPSIWEVLRGS